MKYLTLLVAIILASCTNSQNSPVLISSVEGRLMQKAGIVKGDKDSKNSFKIIKAYEQTIDGFGAVFNELGWDALNMTSPEERMAILREFYSEDGFNFTICRMPIGANDYARSWYSLNDTPGDFGMEDFNLERDLTTLIPYIGQALTIRPDLKIWGSPWCHLSG